MADTLRVIRYQGAREVAFGPRSDYRALIGDEF